MTSYEKEKCCCCCWKQAEMPQKSRWNRYTKVYGYYPLKKPSYKRFYARRAYDSYLGKRRKRDDDSWNDVDSDIVDKTGVNRKNNNYSMEHVYG